MTDVGLTKDWILSLVPPDVPDYAIAAWLGCVDFAISDSKTLEQYRSMTGDQYQFPKTPAEQMIDDETGNSRAFYTRFITWVNENVWGSWTDGDNEND